MSSARIHTTPTMAAPMPTPRGIGVRAQGVGGPFWTTDLSETVFECAVDALQPQFGRVDIQHDHPAHVAQ